MFFFSYLPGPPTLWSSGHVFGGTGYRSLLSCFRYWEGRVSERHIILACRVRYPSFSPRFALLCVC